MTDDRISRVRTRMKEGPYYVDPCHGMLGGPAVIGPMCLHCYAQGEDRQQQARDLASLLNAAWAVGYEDALNPNV